MSEYERCAAPNPEEFWINHRRELLQKTTLVQLMMRLYQHQHQWVGMQRRAEADVDLGLEELTGTFGNALLRAFEGVQDTLGSPNMGKSDKEKHAHRGMTYLAMSSFGFTMLSQEKGEFLDGVGMGTANTLPEFNTDETGLAIARMHLPIIANDTFFEDTRGDEQTSWYRSTNLYISREPSAPDDRVQAHLALRNVDVDFSRLEMVTPYMRYP